MTRSKKLLLNSITSLIFQLVSLICGFILPRMFLTYYGSSVNGLVSSITQFLGFVSLAECGVGAVVQSSLYKPLADNNRDQISRICISSERFFRKIAYILLVYVVILMIFYPMVTLDSFSYGYTMLLIAVISISSFAQYYIGMTYRLLLNADQLGFIQFTIQTIALLLNTAAGILLMKNGFSIQIVKLTTSLIFLMQPLLISAIARRKYHIDRKLVLTEEPIKQKWNGLAQHIAAVVLANTDVAVLTLLSTLKNVSIYAVYNLVVTGLKQLIVSLVNGTQAMFGNMLAKNEMQKLLKTFDAYEWIVHTLVTFVFSVTMILIVPFVRVYTKDVTDANYIVPVFAFFITLAQVSYCLRIPYNTMVLAAGHYRQTQASAILEALINVGVSVVFVYSFGLVGVAIGTLMAMVYRTCYLVYYLSKNILKRNQMIFYRHIFVDALIMTLVLLGSRFFILSKITYAGWILMAVQAGVYGLIIVLVVNFIFYKQTMKESLDFLFKRFRKS
ncbi:lipopolysaccharide biosynthesis protein [Ileibacterium valens]|uniref:lipopolysaccharide biosynthesis protein n=1 Tax=Ileibacterium valens TaxID=1862668 RepID=UPI00259AFB9E|nr:polysaccharide biosynthesis C-terminal domain-containing protein [Ileibacterium valens]